MNGRRKIGRRSEEEGDIMFVNSLTGTKYSILKGIEWIVNDVERKRPKAGFKGAIANCPWN